MPMQVPELDTDTGTLSLDRDNTLLYLYGMLTDTLPWTGSPCNLFLWLPLQETIKPINLYTLHLDWNTFCSNFSNSKDLNGYVTGTPKEVHVGNTLVDLAIDCEGHNILLLDKDTSEILTPTELHRLSTQP